MGVRVKRIYEAASDSDGTRVLVERLWPRGIAKAGAPFDLWLREVAPSTELRRWFGHDPDRWPEFKRRYLAELAAEAAAIGRLVGLARQASLTLIFSSREERYNNAVALAQLLERKLRLVRATAGNRRAR